MKERVGAFHHAVYRAVCLNIGVVLGVELLLQAANVGVGAVGSLELQGGVPQVKEGLPFLGTRTAAWLNLLPAPCLS